MDNKLKKLIDGVPENTSLYFWDAKHPRWTDETFVCTDDEIKKLASEVAALTADKERLQRQLDDVGKGLVGLRFVITDAHQEAVNAGQDGLISLTWLIAQKLKELEGFAGVPAVSTLEAIEQENK